MQSAKGGWLMRYYNFIINASAEEIEKNARVKLQTYGYGNTYLAVNNYIYSNIKNNYFCCVYREADGALYAVFSYDEKTAELNSAYDYICEVLRDAFQVKKIQKQEEITMYQFLYCIEEAKRRDYIGTIIKTIDAAGMTWIYNNLYMGNKSPHLHFDLKERIIPDEKKEKSNM